MAKVNWNAKRTLEHSTLITQCIKSGLEKPRQYDGKCDGYQKSADSDEPCEKCSKCKLNSIYHELKENEKCMVAILKQKNRQRNIRKNMNYML